MPGFEKLDFYEVFSIYQYWGDIWLSGKITTAYRIFNRLTSRLWKQQSAASGT